MSRFRYPDCPRGAACSAGRRGRGTCYYCQPGSPFALPSGGGCSALDRLLLGRL